MPRPDRRHRPAFGPSALITIILIALASAAAADADLDGQATPTDREPADRDIPLPGVTAAITSFVAAGGALWVFGEIYGPYEGSAAVAAAFGITYHWETVRDPVQNEEHQGWPTISTLAAHPVNTNVDQYGFYAGVCMEVASPSVVISRASVHASSDLCGPEPPVMAAYEGAGRALFCGDATMFWPQYFPHLLDSGEVHLLYNMAEWLAGGTPVVTQARSWSSVKASFR